MNSFKLFRSYFVILVVGLSAFLLVSCGDSSDSYNNEISAETLENIARVLWMTEVDPKAFPADIIEKLQSSKNSEKAFGERFRYLLEDMKANPDSFTPSYTDLYETFTDYSEKLTPHENYALASNLGMEASRGHAELPTQIAFSFPEDDRPWWEYQAGWHFFVGSVFAANGKEYGIEFMFWQTSILPETIARELGLTPIENQVLEMHLAVTPAGGRHYRAKPYIVAGTTGLIGFSSAPFHYTLGNNSMRSLQADSLFPIEIKAWGLDNTQGTPIEMEINITLNQAKPYMLNGDCGLDPSCGGVGTIYYSVTNLPVDPENSWIMLDGQKIELTGGKLWYDHQWGSNPSATNPRVDVLRAAQNLEEKQPDGWEWIAVMFDDDTEFSLSVPKTNDNKKFYMQTGPQPPGEMLAKANGMYNDENGNYTAVTGTIRVTEWLKSTISHDQYMATDTWYPNQVEVTMDEAGVPENKRQFTLIQIVNTGQVGWFAPGWQYSEGAVYVEASDGTLIGRGFLELTGYADFRKQLLHIAGLPENQEMMELLDIRLPSDELVLESEIFLAIPENKEKLQKVLSTCRGRNF